MNTSDTAVEVEKDQYRCIVCGYIYDPAKGDPDNDIPAGTAFKDLPDSWVCPVCGVDKASFEKVRDYEEVQK